MPWLGRVLRPFQRVSEECPGAGDAQPHEDGEAEHGVWRAGPLIECHACTDHGDRKPYIESDEQIRGDRQSVLGRRCFEHQTRSPFEDGAGARADEPTAEEKQREARCSQTHGRYEQHEP